MVGGIFPGADKTEGGSPTDIPPEMFSPICPFDSAIARAEGQGHFGN